MNIDWESEWIKLWIIALCEYCSSSLSFSLNLSIVYCNVGWNISVFWYDCAKLCISARPLKNCLVVFCYFSWFLVVSRRRYKTWWCQMVIYQHYQKATISTHQQWRHNVQNKRKRAKVGRKFVEYIDQNNREFLVKISLICDMHTNKDQNIKQYPFY